MQLLFLYYQEEILFLWYDISCFYSYLFSISYCFSIKADDHGGVVQNIQCTQKFALQCHFANNSFCELVDHSDEDYVRNYEYAKTICGGTKNKTQTKNETQEN